LSLRCLRAGAVQLTQPALSRRELAGQGPRSVRVTRTPSAALAAAVCRRLAQQVFCNGVLRQGYASGFVQVDAIGYRSQGLTGNRSTGKIHSLRTFHKYVDSVKLAGKWAREHAGLRHLDALTPAISQQYLEERAAGGLSQKQLDADRNALEFITGRASLDRVFSINPAPPRSRRTGANKVSYSPP